MEELFKPKNGRPEIPCALPNHEKLLSVILYNNRILMLFLEDIKLWILSEGFLFGFQFNTALGGLLFHNTYSIIRPY